MAEFIKLTRTAGGEIYVNIENITTVELREALGNATLIGPNVFADVKINRALLLSIDMRSESINKILKGRS